MTCLTELNELNEFLSNYVQNICRGRDESHGHSHMEKVANTATYIVNKDFKDHPDYLKILKDSLIVAWLHDVSDHKYDKDGTLDERLDEFGFFNLSSSLG